MRKVSDAVREVVEADPFLRLGLAQRLMNLSQVARHIHAAVAALAQKEVKHAAITMALSRLQTEIPDPGAGPRIRLAERLTVQRGLMVLGYTNTPSCHADLTELQRRVRAEAGYLTITEGIQEITLITEGRLRSLVDDTVTQRPRRDADGMASISVALSEEHLGTPGILYRLLQPLALLGLNVAEVASTTREFHIYLPEADVMLAMEALVAAYPGR